MAAVGGLLVVPRHLRPAGVDPSFERNSLRKRCYHFDSFKLKINTKCLNWNRDRRSSRQTAVRAAQAGVPGEGSLPSGGRPGEEEREEGGKLAALWGHSGSPGRHLGVTITRTLLNVVNAYNAALVKHPVATKALTSLIGFAVGDRIAQSIGTGHFDIWRCLRLSLYGLLIDGPIGHYFYQLLDSNICPEDPKSTRSVLTKTAIDQLIWAPVMTVVFLAFITALEGKPSSIWSVVQAKLGPIYLANLSVWPLWHLINFRYVAPEQRILFNNLVAVAWTTYLSWSCGAGNGGSAFHGGPRSTDMWAVGLPCGAQAAASALLKSHHHHVADALRQTAAVESMLGGWGPDGLPNADAGAELLVNYATMKAEVLKAVCSSHGPGL